MSQKRSGPPEGVAGHERKEQQEVLNQDDSSTPRPIADLLAELERVAKTEAMYRQQKQAAELHLRQIGASSREIAAVFLRWQTDLMWFVDEAALESWAQDKLKNLRGGEE